MSIFERIHVQGFRRLHSVNLQLKPLNVVIGANGSGKTSLLDMFSLLAASAFGRLKETMSDLGGIDANLTNLLAANGNKARFMAFDLAMGAPEYTPSEYRIATTHSYVKTRDAARILKGESLSVAINACPELKAFVNTIIGLCS